MTGVGDGNNGPIGNAMGRIWRPGGETEALSRDVPAETPVAMVFNNRAYAVMMASPSDLEDFALGFSLAEGIVESADEIRHQTLTSAPKGVIARMTIPDQRAEVLEGRGRGMAGNTGCGICGTREIEDVLTPLPRVTADIRFDPATVHEAVARIAPLQTANQRTGAMHAAAFAGLTGEIQAIREDVGRHNALDKLIGALAREGRDPAQGFAILTSRCSFELVRKAAHAGIAMLVTVSAPTALAIELADQANVTVVALARGDSMTIFADNAGRLGINP